MAEKDCPDLGSIRKRWVPANGPGEQRRLTPNRMRESDTERSWLGPWPWGGIGDPTLEEMRVCAAATTKQPSARHTVDVALSAMYSNQSVMAMNAKLTRMIRLVPRFPCALTSVTPLSQKKKTPLTRDMPRPAYSCS